MRRSAGLGGAALGTAAVFWAGAAAAQAGAPPEGAEVEEVVVTGVRAAQAKALEVKREATVILDAVSADDVGKLPDNNAADALQRLPGVTATIDQGEGRYVVVRGVDPSLVNVTVNGRIFPGPEGGARRVALDTFPADVISRLEVIKALTPDLDANAVGGVVNIVTPSPFDSEGFLRASARVGYNELSGRNTYAGSGAYSGRFGPDEQFGVVLAASLSYRDYESDNYEANGWRLVNGQALPSSRVLRDYQIVRERQGLVANLEWRPSDDLRLYVNNTFARYADDEQRDSVTFEYALGALSNQTPAGGRYSGGRGTVELRDRKVIQTLYNVSAGGEYELGRLTLDANLTFAQADEDTPKRVDWEFRSGTAAFPNAYDVSGEYIRIETTPASLQFDAARYPFRRVRNRTDDVGETTWALTGDARYDFADRPGYLKAGVSYVTRDKSWDRANSDFALAPGASFLLSEVDKPGATDHLGDNFVLGPVIDRDPIRNVFRDNFDRFRFDEASSRSNSLVTDFDAEEEVLAGYGMGELTVAGVAVTAGVRVEHTEGTYESFDLRRIGGAIPSGAPPRRRESTEYTHVLPDVLLRYDLGEDLVLRAAYTNTIGRPNYTDVVPRRDFDVAGAGAAAVLTGSEGNPELEPFESENLDASLEWYLGVGGVLSLGLFQKDIQNPVYTLTDERFDVVFEGQRYSRLSLSRPENADSGELRGLEVNYQQTFDFLPGALSGFGVSANYTRVDSETEVFGRADDLPFFRQSDELGNLQVFFENERVEARVAVTYASPYLDALVRPDFDVYVDERVQVDLRAAYRLNEQVQISADVLNLNGSALRYYVGDSSRRAAEERYGPSVSVGVNMRF